MLPFCGYHMGDYFAHWLRMGRAVEHPPKIFAVNWFRKDPDGRFVWPGFSENMRVLRWIVERCEGAGHGQTSVVGIQPTYEDLDWTGSAIGPDRFATLMNLDRDEWVRELHAHDSLFAKLGERSPKTMQAQRAALHKQIG